VIYPVILCGGVGTRLWPLSRESYPKQFQNLIGEHTLFQDTAARLCDAQYAPPTVLTASDFRFIVTQQLAEIGVDPRAVLIEPEGRNTAPAILSAALHIHAQDPDAMIIVAPSDHMIPGKADFLAAVERAMAPASEGTLVTFGIAPDRPETGYGYLELDSQPEKDERVKLTRFVEKPDSAKAEAMLASGGYLWNAGIFLFSAKAIIAAFDRLQPAMVKSCRAALDAARSDLGFLRLDPEAWASVGSISVDYAIMEQVDDLAVVPFLGRWSDLGGWEAVWREHGPDADGVATSGAATAIECRDVLLRSEDPGLEIVGLGLENIVAVAMPDAVLVADKRRVEDVKTVVNTLRAKNVGQAVRFPRDQRPWGYFESLICGDRFQVKRIVVNPGASLSLQSHHHRSEHWIVVEGTASVTIDETVKLVTENQSVYIPLGSVHRMENPGQIPMVLIEVQTGAYLGEDDIVRYEDIYARS